MQILRYPNRALAFASTQLDYHEAFGLIVEQMCAAIKEHSAAGIAANQLGYKSRMCAIARPGGEPLVMINPQIEWQSTEMEFDYEHCLSLPGISCNIERPKEVRVSWTGIGTEGDREHHQSFGGFFARVVCHEVEHLNGQMMFVNLPKLRRDALLSKIRRWLRIERDNQNMVLKLAKARPRAKRRDFGESVARDGG